MGHSVLKLIVFRIWSLSPNDFRWGSWDSHIFERELAAPPPFDFEGKFTLGGKDISLDFLVASSSPTSLVKCNNCILF